jgi:hypothetical protein
MASPRAISSWPRRSTALGARLAPLLLASCSALPPQAPRSGPARVFRIERAAQLLDGPMAEGTVGDWRLENDRIAVIVSGIDRPTGFSQSGGNVIDAAARGPGGEWTADELRHVFLYLNAEYPREALYDQARPATSGGRAALVVNGRDSHAPYILIQTTYEIAPGAAALLVRTHATNTGSRTVANYRIGDVLQWGATEHFAPGLGTRFRDAQQTPWLAGAGETTSYGYTGGARTMLSGNHGSSWSDVNVVAGDLLSGGSLEAVRYVVVGAGGGVGAVLGDVLRLRGERFGMLAGAATERRTGLPVADARVTVERPGSGLATIARCDRDGRYVTALGPGDYRARMDAPGRSGPRGIAIHIDADEETHLDGTLAEGALLRYAITDEAGGPLPVKITVLGVGTTPDPTLGPRHRAAGAGNVALAQDGRGVIPLAPGRYRAVATRGLEYDAAEMEFAVEPGKPADFRAALRRVVDTHGFISADLHEHALPSPDSAVALRDRVLSNLTSGVEVMVATDHDSITDYAPIIARMGAGRLLTSIAGNEATTTSHGHFNAFPLVARPGRSRNGAFLAADMTGAQVLAALRAIPTDKVVQVNHPRAGQVGYFNAVRFDPLAPDLPKEMDAGFDALEILNGKRLDGLAPVLQDWFSLLARGMRVVATGNSDTHAIAAEEAGYPRNFIAVPDDAPDRVTAADLVAGLRDRRNSLLTTGPFLRVAVAGQPIGSMVRARGSVEVAVEIWAAPWVDVATVEVWSDGRPVATRAVEHSDRPLRLRASIPVPIEHDTALVVIARGNRPLAPYVSTDPDFAATPIAVANPVWIDANGNGRFDAPGVAALRP